MPRVQMIQGIPFSYQPPPRTIVPHAAGLKGQGSRCALPHLPLTVKSLAGSLVHQDLPPEPRAQRHQLASLQH